jgi:hypothetical protein
MRIRENVHPAPVVCLHGRDRVRLSGESRHSEDQVRGGDAAGRSVLGQPLWWRGSQSWRQPMRLRMLASSIHATVARPAWSRPRRRYAGRAACPFSVNAATGGSTTGGRLIPARCTVTAVSDDGAGDGLEQGHSWRSDRDLTKCPLDGRKCLPQCLRRSIHDLLVEYLPVPGDLHSRSPESTANR